MSQGAFLSRIKSKKPLLADGAMGTLLHTRGIPIDAAFDELNLTRPELVLDIHRAYIDAGADLIETNTFGANRFKLAEQGLELRVKDVVSAGVALAKRATAENEREVFVAGSVGPLGVSIQPYGRIKAEEAHAAFAEQ
ncbi:MAG: homocysteine S-methyltransferase family protein, partial [Anaerolineae bacterium]|nr:homocysteine S-methyltransferase family protein [Anaerolineae bacterium]